MRWLTISAHILRVIVVSGTCSGTTPDVDA